MYCLRRVEEELGEGHEAFIPLRKANYAAYNQGADATKTWLASGGLEDSERWLREHEGHLLEPFARYCLGRSLITAVDFDAGREQLQVILTEDSRRSTLRENAQLWVGISYLREGDSTKAREVFGALLRDFSYTKSAK